MAAAIGDDDFDQFDKPGSERSRRRRTSDDEWDSELDDLLEEDLLSGKKTQSDFSDEELNDDLLQSDEEDHDQEANSSSEGVTVSLNATTGMTASFELSKSTNAAPEAELDEADDEVIDEDSEEAAYAEEYTEGHYEGTDVADLTRDLMEYAEEQEEEEIDTDEVLDLEINEPLDEFPDDELVQFTVKQEYVAEEQFEDVGNSQETSTGSEEMVIKTEEEIKEESDEEEDDDEESGRLRFKTERKEGNIIRLSEAARERRNIPETLELSNEDKAALMEFEERERQRKQGYYGGKRGGYARRRGAVHVHGMGDQRRDNSESGKMKDHRPPLATQPSLGQPIRSLFQQQPIKPLLPMPRPRHSSPAQTKAESARGNNTPPSTPHQPKNIHINPHFKGSVVTPVQTPLLPTPNQPRSAAPQRFPGPPDFHPHTPSHIPANFNPGPRLPPPDQWRSPPPVQEREPFFIGDPRFSNHHLFDQRSPPPPPPHPPPLLNSNHPMPNQGPLAFGLPGPGFNLPGQPSGFNLQGQHSGFCPPGHQPGYSPQGQQPDYNQPGQPPRFNPQGQPPPFNQQGTQPGYSQPGTQPGFNQQGQQHGFTQQGQQSGFNQVQPPGFNSSGQSSGFNQHGQQSGFNQHGQQSSYNQHGQQSGYSHQGQQPGFNQQGPPHGFSRDRPIRPNIQPPGLVHYNHPPRQQFTPGPGQPFLPHAQANIQTPLHHTMPPPPHQTGPPQPLLPIPSSQFRPHLQTSQAQQSNNRIPRQSAMKTRHITPSQNVGKRGNPPSLPRNSNLRELPIAPSQVTEITNSRQRSVPAAQVKPIAHSGSAAPGRTAVGARKSLEKMAKPVNLAAHPKTEVKEVQKIPDEDEETRLYRLKIEEQKRLREEILKRKEIRRQQQAGARKKELLERLAQQHSPSTQVLTQDHPSSQIPINSNQAVLQPATPFRQNVKNRVVAQKHETFTNVQHKNSHFHQGAGTHLQFQAQQGEQRILLNPIRPKRQAPQNPVQPVQKIMHLPAAQPATVLTSVQTAKVASVQGTPLERKAVVKRTVMQRANSGSGDGPHIGAKVRVIKLSGAQGAEHSAFAYTEGQPYRLPISQQQHLQQQRQQQIRKVTLTKTLQQQQTQIQPTVAQGVQSIQGLQQPKKVIMRGRGRGAASQMGRGRMMQNKPNLRVVECKPQPCTVSVEGLSSSTTDFQLQSLLMSVGPIESFQMLPEQRKAIAKFTQPEHASSFQLKFHRHMIDLSHINVLLLAE